MPGVGLLEATGLKKKLTITRCQVGTDGTITALQGDSDKFEVMLNPDTYTNGFEIKYNENRSFGDTGLAKKFSSYRPQNISFSLVIDGTGVVNLPNPPSPFGSPDVKTQVGNLKKIIYDYDGEEHRPDAVRVLWGSLIFFGSLQKFTLDYTLFKPSGEPLRAKVGLEFSGLMSETEASLKANRSSPDLTHVVEVRAGDTLPLLCYRIYKNSSYYPDVARVNNIINFRDIRPGTQLRFPPLQ